VYTGGCFQDLNRDLKSRDNNFAVALRLFKKIKNLSMTHVSSHFSAFHPVII